MRLNHLACWYLLTLGESRKTVSYRGQHCRLELRRFSIGETEKKRLQVGYHAAQHPPAKGADPWQLKVYSQSCVAC